MNGSKVSLINVVEHNAEFDANTLQVEVLSIISWLVYMFYFGFVTQIFNSISRFVGETFLSRKKMKIVQVSIAKRWLTCIFNQKVISSNPPPLMLLNLKNKKMNILSIDKRFAWLVVERFVIYVCFGLGFLFSSMPKLCMDNCLSIYDLIL